jgi:CBS domain containing-hemolysin-like protein
MSTSLILVLMLLCLVMEAFFTGSEIAVVSTDRLHLRHMAANGSRGAQIALDMLKKPEWLLSTTLVGTNIAIVTNASLATTLVVRLFGQERSWLAILFIAPFVWVFGEIVPKSIFQQRSSVITPRAIFILKGASYLFFPILFVFSHLAGLFTRLLGGSEEIKSMSLRESIYLKLNMADTVGDIHPVEKTLIRRSFDFAHMHVQDIMVPLVDVVAIPNTASCKEARKIAGQQSHPRILVYSNRVDNLIGWVNAIELLGEPDEHPVTHYIRSVSYLPSSTRVNSLLLLFQNKQESLAVVVDEFGSAEGIVTMKDTLAKIVGDLDEADALKPLPSENEVQFIDKKHVLVNARINLLIMKEETGLVLPEGPYKTLSGFLLNRLEYIPQKGETLTVGNIEFKIEQASPRAIEQVRIQWGGPYI